MKTTQHFEDQIKRRNLKREWCEKVARSPKFSEKTATGRTKCWGWVPEIGHTLRVVILEDGETLHTAMIDSGEDGRYKP